MATEQNLSFEEFMAMMKEKDPNEEFVILEGAHPAGEEYLDEANQALRKSVAYLKRIEAISSKSAEGLIAGD